MTDTAFHFSDGSKAQTLQELASVLRKSDSSVTARHVTPERNDYALWVLHVHNDQLLSNEIRKCRTPQEVATAIEKKLAPKPTQPLTPLKEKLRAIAPKPTLATPARKSEPVQSNQSPATPSPVVNKHPAPEHGKPPEWTPSTPLPKRSPIVTAKNNPHVRDFVLGLIIGIVIGILAYGLLLQVI